MKALIIDDSRTRRRVLASYLSEFTTDIYEAVDGLEAIERLQRHAPIDLALVNADKPGSHGVDFAKAVSADPVFAGTRLLMVTSSMTVKMITDNIRRLGLDR